MQLQASPQPAQACRLTPQVVLCSSKGTLPNSLQPRLRALETRVAVVGSPLWTRLHITSDRVLWQLDSKVLAPFRVNARSHVPKHLGVRGVRQQVDSRMQSTEGS